MQALVLLLQAEIRELKAALAASAKSAAGGVAAGTGSRSGAAAGGGGGSGGSGAAAAGGGSGGSGAGAAGGGSAGGGATAAAAAGSGSSGAAAQQVLQTTSSRVVVSVNLDATKQTEAVVGAPVTVQLPDGSTDSGKITKVSSVAQSSTSSSSSGGGGGAGGSSSTPSSTVPVTITLTGRRHVAALDQAAVSVNFEQQVQRGVLAVPVTALLATAGGGYAVQTVGPGPRHLVPVTPGLFGGGYVEVSGSGLSEGLRVSDAQG
jgi:hypothetical protein